MSINLHLNPRHNSVLNAAVIVFSRYGFERGTLADVAREAGLSRPLIYLLYPNKTALFVALAQAMADDACAKCALAWPLERTFERGLATSAYVVSADAWRLMKESTHGFEIFALKNPLVGHINLGVDAFFINLIKARLIRHHKSVSYASMIAAAVHGIKDKAISDDELMANLASFAYVVTVGLGLSVSEN